MTPPPLDPAGGSASQIRIISSHYRRQTLAMSSIVPLFHFFPTPVSRRLHLAPAESSLKRRPHQQQCWCNLVKCYKSNDSFDTVECWFDLLPFLATMLTVLVTVSNEISSFRQSCFDFVDKTKFRSTFAIVIIVFGCNYSSKSSLHLLPINDECRND